MGHDNTKRIHLHGIIWTELTEEQFEREWGYGWIFFGYEVNEKTINYIIKYITKRDEDSPEFNGKIFTSKKIGSSYINKNTLDRHKYQDGKVKKNRFIRRHNLHPEEDLRALQLMILTLDFPAPDYSVMRVKSDAGKVRDIVKQKYFPWRILHHAIMR